MSPHQQHENASPEDQRIDQVLAALDRTEAPASLEKQVLQRLAQHEEFSRRTPWGAFTGPVLPWRMATFCAGALLLVAILLLPQHRKPHPMHPQAPSRVPVTVPDTCHLDRRPRFCGRSGETPVFRTSEKFTQTRGSTALPAAIPPEQATIPDGPAPELPLTEQERLLLRIAHGPQKPQQIASLKRFTVHLRPEEDGPDFQTFFEPYTTPLTQGDPQ